MKRPVATAGAPLLGRTFVLSLLGHGAILGSLAGLYAGGTGSAPAPVVLDTSLGEPAPLEPSVALDPALPEPGPPPAETEFLLDEIPVEPDPRFVVDPAAAETSYPVIGLPGPGSRPLPRIRRPGKGAGAGPGTGGGGTGPAPAPAVEAAPLPAPRAVVATLARPVAGECEAPAYPARERERGVEGSVRLRVAVAADGSVESVEVALTSGSAALDEAAQECVRGWRFHPATADGRPVPSVVLQPVSFRLR